MDLNVHGLPFAVWRDDDAVDHGAQAGEQGIAGLALAQAVEVLAQFTDDLAVFVGGGRVQRDGLGRIGERCQLLAQGRTFRLESPQALDNGVGAPAINDQVNQVSDGFIQIGRARLDHAALAGRGGQKFAALGMIAGDVGGDHVRISQVDIKRLQHPVLDMGAGDGPVVGAVAAFAEARASQPVIAQDGVAGAAAAALGEPGQHVARLGCDRPAIGSALVFAGSDQAEHVAVDDGQMRRLGLDPFRFRVETRHALACGRILDEALPVPDHFTDIEPVLQHAIGPAARSIERRAVPFAAARPGDAFAVEGCRDFARRGAGQVVGKNAPHHSRFPLMDFVLPGLAGHGTIAVADAAARRSGRHARLEAAPRLVAQLGQEHFAHQALEAGVHGGDRAIRHGHDANAEEGQLVADAVQIGLLARQAIEILANQHVKALLAGHAQHAGQPRPVDGAGAGHSLVGEGRDDIEPLPLGPSLTIAGLVFAGAFVLEVGAKAGVDRGAGRRCHPVRSPPDDRQWPVVQPEPRQKRAAPPEPRHPVG